MGRRRTMTSKSVDNDDLNEPVLTRLRQERGGSFCT